MHSFKHVDLKGIHTAFCGDYHQAVLDEQFHCAWWGNPNSKVFNSVGALACYLDENEDVQILLHCKQSVMADIAVVQKWH